MQLILAIDSDSRQSEKLAALVHARLTVDLVQATSAGEGLQAIKDRVPDLILTSPLLSPFDDGVLDEYFRDLGAAAAHVQTLRIPVLATPKKKSAARSLFSLGRKKPTPSSTPDGCDPRLFADEIAQYLTRAAESRPGSSAKGAAAGSPFDDAPAIPETFQEPPEPVDLVEEFLVDPVEPEPAYAFEPSEPVYVDEPEVTAPVYAAEPVYTTEPVYSAEPVYTTEAVYIEEPVAPLVVDEPADIAYTSVLKSPVEPEPVSEPQVMPEPQPLVATEPERNTKTAAKSASFEAALAAIRAAWVKPAGDQSVAPAVPSAPPAVNPTRGPVNGSGKPLGASSAEVDLTNEVDSLEDVVGSDSSEPMDDEPSSNPSKATPSAQRKVDKHKKRQEKAQTRKMRGPDGRPTDEWGVFDPTQCGFSTLVNKLDEVTDSDEVTARASTALTTSRVISVG